MNQSLLYHAYNIKGIKYKRTTYLKNTITFTVDCEEKHLCCSNCGNRENLIKKGSKTRKLKLPPIHRKQVYLDINIPRIECPKCNKIRFSKLPFMLGKQTFTKAFANYAIALLNFLTVSAVAGFLSVGWNLIKNIHKNYLEKKRKKLVLKDLKYIAIDEFHIGNKKYMTIVIDLQSGHIIYANEGKGKESIKPFLKQLSKKAKKLKAVSIDMSAAYFSAIQEVLKDKVDIVFDHFHITALMNKKLDDLRKTLYNDLNKEEQKVLKGTRFLLLKKYEAIDKKGQNRLRELFQANEQLFIMHSMKEQFRLFWNYKDIKKAEIFLMNWCKDAAASGIKQLKTIAKTFYKYKEQLLNYFKHFISSGKIEGINNKIKTIKRQAYGFRDMEYFKLILLYLHYK